MSKTGMDYVHYIGGRYKVRVQVPQELRSILKQAEFKHSLGPDISVARRERHAPIASFLAKIERARQQLNGSAKLTADGMVGRREIRTAVRNHYRRMAQQISKHGASNIQTKIASLTDVIDAHLSINAQSAWSALANDARWLCEEHGWQMDEESSDFEYLCETMLQARVQAYRDEIRRLMGKRGQDPEMDPLFSEDFADDTNGPTLGSLIDQFVAERELSWSASTKVNYRIIIRVLEEICGRDTSVSDIDKAFCISVRDTLRQLPSNYQKKPQTKDRPLKEVIEIGARLSLPKMLPATINSHLSKLGAIVRVGRDNGLILGNPMAGVEVPDDVRPEEKRDPYTVAQLNEIFATAPWSGGQQAALIEPKKYWSVLIGLFSGARLSEIMGIPTEDVVEREGVLVFHFKHRPGHRSMKGRKSRMVPVHSVLLELGFRDFLNDAKSSSRTLLFPEVTRNTNGVWGNDVSRWFSGKIRSMFLKGTSLTFHSLRHTFEDALREADLHDIPIGNAITGRTGEGTSKIYGRGFSTAKLAEAMEKIRYPGLNLDHLRN